MSDNGEPDPRNAVDTSDLEYDDLSGTEQRLCRATEVRVRRGLLTAGTARKVLLGVLGTIIATATLTVAGQALLLWRSEPEQNRRLDIYKKRIEEHGHPKLDGKVAEVREKVIGIDKDVDHQGEQLDTLQDTADENRELLRDLHRRYGTPPEQP